MITLNYILTRRPDENYVSVKKRYMQVLKLNTQHAWSLSQYLICVLGTDIDIQSL